MRKLDKRREALNIQVILNEYESGKSLSDIADMLNTSRSSVTRRLQWAGVKLRSVNEACAYFRNQSFKSDKYLDDIFVGLLLSDAWIESDGRSEGRLAISQCEAHLEWLVSLKEIFDSYQIKSTLVKTKNRGWLLRTGKYANFTNLYKLWYSGNKIIPRNVMITPVVLAHWHWGDGTITSRGYTISLCTDGFSYEDVLFLISKLKENLGIDAQILHRKAKYYRINIYRRHSKQKFKNYVQEYCPDCFQYKIEVK